MLWLLVSCSVGAQERSSKPQYDEGTHFAFAVGAGDAYNFAGLHFEFRYKNYGVFVSKIPYLIADIAFGLKYFQHADASGFIFSLYSGIVSAQDGYVNLAATIGMRHRFATKAYFEWGIGYAVGANYQHPKPDPEYPNPPRGISGEPTQSGPGIYGTRLPAVAIAVGYEW